MGHPTFKLRRQARAFSAPLITCGLAALLACSSAEAPTAAGTPNNATAGAAGTLSSLGGGGGGSGGASPSAGNSGTTTTSSGSANGGASAGNGGASAGNGGASGGAMAGSGGVTGGGGGATAGAGAGGTAGSGGASVITGTAKIMVVGSSNELVTCWRAFLWQKLQAAEIKNFDLVGGVTSGPDCGVAGYDKDLQAMSGIIISNLPASTYQGWFSAHPPDIILMHFGGADLLANMPVDGVMKAYSLALAQARMVNPKVRLLIAQHTPEASGGCQACEANVLELNTDIVTWAVANNTAESPVASVDLYTGLVPATDLSDGVHLNEAGSQKVSDRWFAALKPMFKP